MPPTDWKQTAKERPFWIHKGIEDAFWKFVNQKWKDSFIMAAVEPVRVNGRQGTRNWP